MSNVNQSDDQYYKETYSSTSGLHKEVEKAYRDAKFEPQITPKQAIKMKFDQMYGENPALAAKIRKRINAIWRFFTPTIDDFVIFEVTDIGSDFVGNESYRTYKVGMYDLPSFQFVKDQMSGQPTSVKVSRKERKYEIKYSPQAIEEILNSGDSSMTKLYINDGRFTYMIYNLDDFINLPGEQLIESIYEQRTNAQSRGDERVSGNEGKLIKGDALERGAAMPEPHTRRSSGVATRRAGVRPNNRYVQQIENQVDFERGYTAEHLGYSSVQPTPANMVTADNRIASTIEHDAVAYENARAALQARLAAAKATAQQKADQGEANPVQFDSEGNQVEVPKEKTIKAKALKPQPKSRRGNKATGKMSEESESKQNLGPNAKLSVKETVHSEVKPDPNAQVQTTTRKREVATEDVTNEDSNQ